MHTNCDFYEAVAASDPNFGHHSDAIKAAPIFKATNQLRQNNSQ